MDNLIDFKKYKIEKEKVEQEIKDKNEVYEKTEAYKKNKVYEKSKESIIKKYSVGCSKQILKLFLMFWFFLCFFVVIDGNMFWWLYIFLPVLLSPVIYFLSKVYFEGRIRNKLIKMENERDGY